MSSVGAFTLVMGDPPAHASGARPLHITVAGELDVVSAPALWEAVGPALATGRPRHLEIDVSGITFLDSSGIRALLHCHADADRMACRMTLTGPRPGIRRVLEITGLLEHFGLA